MRTLVLKKIKKIKNERMKEQMKEVIIEKLKETLNLCKNIKKSEGNGANNEELHKIKKDVDSLSEYINDISISNRKKD